MRRQNKYNAKKIHIDGYRFDSKKESERYIHLKYMLDKGQIKDLKMQVKFAIVGEFGHICNYYADFTYIDCNGKFVVEDVKGYKTDVYKLKKKMMKAINNIAINEV